MNLSQVQTRKKSSKQTESSQPSSEPAFKAPDNKKKVVAKKLKDDNDLNAKRSEKGIDVALDSEDQVGNKLQELFSDKSS